MAPGEKEYLATRRKRVDVAEKEWRAALRSGDVQAERLAEAKHRCLDAGYFADQLYYTFPAQRESRRFKRAQEEATRACERWERMVGGTVGGVLAGLVSGKKRL